MNEKFKFSVVLFTVVATAAAIASSQVFACGSEVVSGDGGGSQDGSSDGGGGSDGGTKTCDDYKNACLMVLKNGCFNPSGACVISGIKEAKWDNGAKITFQTVGTSSEIVTWFSSSGKTCFYANAPLSSQDNYIVTITTSDAKAYILNYTKADSSVTVTCPNATVEKYSQDDFTVLNECYGGQWSETVKNCTWDKELCKSDLDCLLSTLGQTCCEKYGFKYCSKSCS